MSERETILEEVRAAFASLFLTNKVGGKYIGTKTDGSGCETCDHGANKVIDMDEVNEVVEYLKTNVLAGDKS